MGPGEEQPPCVKCSKPPLTPEERLIQKREKRKQSNRDSAKRSRLRKEFERRVLEVKVEGLTNENNCLKGEMKKLFDECQKLKSENVSLKKRESLRSLDLEKVPVDDDAVMDGGNDGKHDI